MGRLVLGQNVSQAAQFVESRGLAARMGDAQKRHALAVLMPLRHAAWGANMNNASVCAYGYGTAFTAPVIGPLIERFGAHRVCIVSFVAVAALTGVGFLVDRIDRAMALPGVDAASLHRRTGGNPMFALETLKLLWAEGAAAPGRSASDGIGPVSIDSAS